MSKAPLPQNVEAEEVVLGSILVDGDAFKRISSAIESSDFIVRKHQRIFDAMTYLDDKGKDIDLVTIANVLHGKVPAADLSALMDKSPSSARIEHHAGIVRDKSIRRQLIAKAADIYHLANGDGEVDDVVADAEKKIISIGERCVESSSRHVKKVMMNTVKMIERNYKNKGGLTGVSTGYPELDALTGGLNAGEYFVLAGRPSMGKTAFAMEVAMNVAREVPVLVFSLEMSAEMLTQRMIASRGSMNSLSLRRGMVTSGEWPKIMTVTGEMANLQLSIDDSSSLTDQEVRVRSRRHKSEHGLGLVVLDYLGLMRGQGLRANANREQEVSAMSRSMKAMAKELNCPVMALSQLSRGVEARQDKRPLLSDLRESGSIEQDADVVAFIYREAHYDDKADQDAAELIIRKQRNGPTDTVRLRFVAESVRFDSVTDMPSFGTKDHHQKAEERREETA